MGNATGPLVTVETYVAAFETWRGLARLADAEAGTLTAALAHLRARFDATPRTVEAFCGAFDAFLQARDRDAVRGGLRLRITKSCLLDRLLHLGEEPRTVRCPAHEGRWSGLQAEPCPHGCNLASCGCTTGWLPTRATLQRGAAHYVAAVARAEAAGRAQQADMWRRRLDEIRAGLAALGEAEDEDRPRETTDVR